MTLRFSEKEWKRFLAATGATARSTGAAGAKTRAGLATQPRALKRAQSASLVPARIAAAPDLPARCVEVELPLPPRALGGNSRVHWAVRQRAVRGYRTAAFGCFMEAFEGQPALRTPIRICYEFFTGPTPGLMVRRRGARDKASQRFYRPKDHDNATIACKPALDSLRDAGLIPDDSASHVVIEAVRIFRDPQEHGGRCCVVVRIVETLANEKRRD